MLCRQCWTIPLKRRFLDFALSARTLHSLLSLSLFAALAGAFDAVVCWHHARGGEGAVDLAKAIAAACEQPAQFKFLYPLELSIKV